MSLRKPFIAGNWKMNLNRKSGLENVQAIHRFLQSSPGSSQIDVAVFPPFVYLSETVQALKGSVVRVGAQNVHFEEKGAFTGEIAPGMLRDLGVSLVVLGHSERRHVFGESEDWIAKKLRAALAAGLEPILCVGEKLEEREAGQTTAVVERQVFSALEGVSPSDLSRITIAYEPVWAIGTGKTATVEQAAEVHRQIRELLGSIYLWLISRGVCAGTAEGDQRKEKQLEDSARQFSNQMRIQYGGSVTAENASSLLLEPEIDGFLVGGASLDPAKFQKILEAGISRSPVKSR